MKFHRLSPDFAVSPQIQAEDLPELARAGIRSIVCNRPDGERPDQPSFSQIEQAAARLGIEARYLPATPQNVTDEHGAAFGRLMAELPKPVLGYCGTGRRSSTMWALSQAGKQPSSAILDAAANAGYDLGALAPRLEKQV